MVTMRRLILGHLIVLSITVHLSVQNDLEDCQHGWFRFANKCFIVSRSRMTFDSAEEICKKANATLVSIHSKEEQNFLTHLAFVAYKLFENLWIGGVRSNESNHDAAFHWLDGSKFAFTDWWPGEPNFNARKQYCLVMWGGDEFKGKWYDFQCDAYHSFACQKPLPPTENCSLPAKVVRVDMNSILTGVTIALVIITGTVYYFAEFSNVKRLVEEYRGSKGNVRESSPGSLRIHTSTATIAPERLTP